MATRAGRVVADQPGGIIAPGEPADLFVLDGDSPNLVGYQDPVRAVVRRAGVGDVQQVHLQGSYPGTERRGSQ
jgi:cytosine/adenosine deaminase-related metal-dependent hydrolase